MAKKPAVPIDGTFEPAPKDDRIWQEKLRDAGNEWADYLLGPHKQTAEDLMSFLPSQSIVDLLTGSSTLSKGVMNKNPWEAGMGLTDMLTSGVPGPSISPAMILTLAAHKVSPSKIADLKKLQGSRDLLEIFNKEGAWLDPATDNVKTMIGKEALPSGKSSPFTGRFYDELIGKKTPSRGSLSQYLDLPALFATYPEAINQKFHVVENSPFVPKGTKGQYHDDKSFVFLDNIINQSDTGKIQDIVKDAESTALHELTHASQDMGGGLYEASSDDYFTNYLDAVVNSNNSNTSPVDKSKISSILDAFGKLSFLDVTNQYMDPGSVPFDSGANFLAYLGHPLEREARASEDMLSKSLEDRAKNYLAGVDSTPAKEPYKSTSGLLQALHDMIVTGKKPVPYIKKAYP